MRPQFVPTHRRLRPTVRRSGLSRRGTPGGRRAPGRQLDRPPHRRRLVLRLLELALGHAAGHDPGARVEVGDAVLQDRAADRDRRVQVAVVAEVADRAAVEAPPLALGRGDQLHRPHLGRPREGPGREDAAQGVERVEAGRHLPLDVAHQVEDVAVALHLHVLGDPHRARPGDTPEVVAPKVDEHHVLGALLRIGLELLGEELVFPCVGAARAGSGDRVRRHPLALDLQEQLGAGADDLERRRPDEEEVRAGVDLPQRAVEADAVERAPVGARRERQRLAPGQDDLDRLPRRDRVLRALHGGLVGLAPQRGLRQPALAVGSGSGTGSGGWGGRRGWPGRRPGDLGGARAGRLLERLEERPLGDPVALLEARRVGVERGDRRQRVGEVVEDEDEVGLDEARQGHPDRVGRGERDRRLEDRDGVVGERADGAAGEARHSLGRLDPPAREEGANGGERVVGRELGHRQVGRVVDHADRAVLDAGPPATDFEEPPRPDAQEAVPPQALAALDQFEEVGGGRSIVETQEGADRGLEIGVAHRPQADRVRAPREALDLAEAQGVLAGHRRGPPETKTTSRPARTKGRDPPRCHPGSASAALIVTDGTDPPSDRRCPLSLALCAGAYWRGRALRGLGRAAFGPEAPGSIRRRRRPGFHQPPGLSAGAATGTRPVHSRVFG